jgi:hypothetical protein
MRYGFYSRERIKKRDAGLMEEIEPKQNYKKTFSILVLHRSDHFKIMVRRQAAPSFLHGRVRNDCSSETNTFPV